MTPFLLGLFLGWAVATPVCVLFILYVQAGGRRPPLSGG